MTASQQVEIVLVEDDPGHARLIEKNLRRAGLVNEIRLMEDGEKAVHYLIESEEYYQKPKLVLLDLNLPVLNGFQVLEKLKSHPQTRKIPVIILTTTDDPREIDRCYELGCNVFLTKPIEYDQFTDAIRKLGFFIQIVRVPDEDF